MHTSNATGIDQRPAITVRQLSSVIHRLFDPVDGGTLCLFRIMFGAFMLYHVWGWCVSGRIGERLVDPAVHFTYYGFGWVRPWPGDLMYLHFYVMAGLSVAILLGLFYRLSAFLFCLAFTYAFLIDKTEFINHYYLCGLISFLLIFLPAHRSFSFDALIWPKRRSDTVPRWALWLVRAQIGVPYFFGGIAKLNSDWLHRQPVRLWLEMRAERPLIGRLFTEEWMVCLVAYGGVIFDLLLVPALLYRKTRLLAYVIAVVFHLSNSQLFAIGIFPWFMIFATLIFFQPDWPRRWMRLPAIDLSACPVVDRLSFGRKLTVSLLGVYLVFQVLFPLRHIVYRDNDPNWTEEGHNFAWHMMLRSKRSAVRFYVTDPATGRTGTINLRDYLTLRQLRDVSSDPDMVLQFTHFLSRRLNSLGFEKVEIRAYALVSLNGRQAQFLVDPEVDLAATPRQMLPADWILPLTEPLRHDAWNVPVSEWVKLFRIEELAREAQTRRKRLRESRVPPQPTQ